MDDEPVVGVLVIDDHQMFAESLGRLLGGQDGIEVLGIATSGHAGVEMAARLHPTVVLVDHQMPDSDGVRVAAEIKGTNPTTMIVMVTGFADDKVLLDAIEAGCSGFLTKDRAASEVVDAVRAAAAGEALISPALLARLLPQLRRGQLTVGSDLTEREREVLGHMAEGRSNKVIATELNLSLNTVRNYVQAVLTKLDAHSKLEAVATAVRAGVIDYGAD